MSGNSEVTTRISLGKVLTILIILVPMGIFAGITVPNIHASVQRSRQKRTMSDMRSIATGLYAFQQAHGGFPSSEHGIDKAWLRLSPSYIVNPPTKDGWGTAYLYEAPADKTGDLSSTFTLISLGSDGKYQGPTSQLCRYFDCDLIYQGP